MYFFILIKFVQKTYVNLDNTKIFLFLEKFFVKINNY